MAKRFYFILAIIIGFECNGQNLMPDRFGFNLYSESYSEVGLSVEDAFKVTGFPELEIQELKPTDFEPHTLINYSVLSIQFGYKIFKLKENKRSTFLDLGFGNSRGYGNVYSEQNTTAISRIDENNIYLLDSIYHYSAISGFRFDNVFAANISLEQDLVNFKSLSLKLGLTLDYSRYQGGVLNQGEHVFVTYSDFFEPEYVSDFLWSMPEITTIMHSLGVVVPFSFYFNPKINNKYIDRFSLGFSFTRGLRFSFIKNVTNFNSRSAGGRFTLRYSFLD